jgi:hypothetical protein
MPHPFPLASAFSGGMRRDVDRTEIPGGSAYNLVDFIPDEVQAVTGGRGGWTYAGPTMSGATQIQTVGFHPDTAKVVAIDQARSLWDVLAGTTFGAGFSTDLTSVPLGPPFYHRGYLIFMGNEASPSTPAFYKSDGSVGSLTGAPQATRGCAYKDHAVLANNGGANTNRLWFSAAGDPTTWDTTFGYWDTTGIVQALAPLTNAILVFHRNGTTERLRGTTPPPGSDFVLEPYSNIGCIDVNSLALWNGVAVWAAHEGVFMSDGVSAPVDLTSQTQMKTYWQSILATYSGSWKIAAGVIRDHYIVSISNGSTLVDCLCFNLPNRTVWRFTNLHGSSFVKVPALGASENEELYMGQWNAGRVAQLSPLWSPSASVKQDGDGTNPTPIVETAMFRGFDRLHRRWIESMGKQKWRWAYVDYDLRDAASDNPTMTLSYCKTPTGAYTATDRTLPETTDVSRIRRSLSPTQGGATHSQMLGLKLAVNGPYASAKLYTLEGAFEPIEIGAL